MQEDSADFLIAAKVNEYLGYSVVFEDDGRVAYAYLLDPRGDIVADVWLYNRSETPILPEWENRQEMPFANPIGFVRKDVVYEVAETITDIEVQWEALENGVPKANIYIRGKLFAVLMPGAKPGWSILAAEDGPLAKVMENK